MASASQITIMRELSAAGDRERTGALDVEWDGVRASLFFIFGHANHVELERADGEKLVGTDALTAIVAELPEEFRVSPWRRAMVTDDTLRCTAEELMFMFRRDPAKSTNRGAPEPPSEPAAEETVEATADAAATPGLTATPSGAPTDDEPEAPPADDSSEQSGAAAESTSAEAGPVTEPSPPFALADFPTLPLGTALFSDAASNVEGLAGAVPHLPDSLIVLNASDARGVVVVAGGAVIDAVWVDETTGRLGDEAAAAVFSATSGTITAHQVQDGTELGEVPSLWRPARDEVAATAAAPAAPPEVEAPGAPADLREPAVFTLPEPAPSESAQPAATVDAETPIDDATDGNPLAAVAVSEAGVQASVDTAEPSADAPEASVDVAEPPVDVAEPAVDVSHDSSAAPAATGDEELAAPPSGEQLTSSDAEFVPARVEVDIDGLRTELVGIADVWLGETDAAPVAAAIRAARPGVDDFVAAIQAIASMEIPGHENAVVRAMAREMHFRAAEVLCGV